MKEEVGEVNYMGIAQSHIQPTKKDQSIICMHSFWYGQYAQLINKCNDTNVVKYFNF